MKNFKMIANKNFANGCVYALRTKDNYPIEVTDTFLPMITLDAEKRGTNTLEIPNFGTRKDRWMIGVSVMSGCPVCCPFCATGALKKWRNLKAEEILAQVEFIVNKNKQSYLPANAQEFKILFTRMGEPVYNRKEVIKAIKLIKNKWPNATIALSTIAPKSGTKDFFQEIKKLIQQYDQDFIQLQFSVHSTNDKQRTYLQPVPKYELAQLKYLTQDWAKVSQRKVTLNFTLCDDNEFSTKKIKKYFNNKAVFIKLSPLNENVFSQNNQLSGIITAKNLA
ncbi:radical SAM protein [Patescibacteria group bacterium]